MCGRGRMDDPYSGSGRPGCRRLRAQPVGQRRRSAPEGFEADDDRPGIGQLDDHPRTLTQRVQGIPGKPRRPVHDQETIVVGISVDDVEVEPSFQHLPICAESDGLGNPPAKRRLRKQEMRARAMQPVGREDQFVRRNEVRPWRLLNERSPHKLRLVFPCSLTGITGEGESAACRTLVPFQRVRGREDESSIVKGFAALRLGVKAPRRTAHGVRKLIRPQLDHPEQQMPGLGISNPGKVDDRLAITCEIHGRCPAGGASLVAESVDDRLSTRHRRSRSLVVCSTLAPATEGGGNPAVTNHSSPFCTRVHGCRIEMGFQAAIGEWVK